MKKTFTKEHLRVLAQDHGVIYMNDPVLALDAQPALTTVPNTGVLAQFLNYVDPEVVNIIFTPMNATRIAPERKTGNWVTMSAQFPIAEAVGHVKGYGDFDNGGESSANFNWENRQSFHYQTITQAGEREIEMMGQGKIDLVSQLNKSSILTLNKFQNKTYFFGVDGLANYGFLNDPDLNPSITAGVKAAGGTSWSDATPKEIYDDIKAMFIQLVTQLGGNVERDAAMVFSCSPEKMVHMREANEVMGNTAENMIKNAFPNLEFESAPEYKTDTGDISQLRVKDVDGIETAYCSFTEKMRAHPVIPDVSSWKQKKSGGTWGAIIRVPAAMVTMIGI